MTAVLVADLQRFIVANVLPLVHLATGATQG
jgi:hypothetical protein